MNSKKRLITFLLIIFQTSFLYSTNYYVDNIMGNDINNGYSPITAWQTLTKVNSFIFSPGDSILFVCGGQWRGQLIPQSGNSSADITYASFGNGQKPELLGSINKSAVSDWTNTGLNIWESTNTFITDVGNLIMDNTTLLGFKKWTSDSLINQGDFWFNKSNYKVYLYSVGNPALLYSNIECAIRQHIIDENNKSYITYKNLAIKYGGAHGVGGGNTHHISIYDCDISYIGGGDIDGITNTRYGNGIEFWGNAHDNRVERCKIWEIYDSGLSNQNHTNTVQQYNIVYRNNIIWNCALAAFEYFNRPSSSTTQGIYFENNTCINSGFGWGGIQRPDPKGGGVVCWNNESYTDSIVIRNNIFYNARRTLIFYDTTNLPLSSLILDYNCYFQFKDSTFIELYPAKFDSIGFTNYQVQFNMDLHSIIANPVFINFQSDNFHIASNSPCIDSGLSINNYTDVDNESRTINLIDIGADEYYAINTVEKISNYNNIVVSPNPAHENIRIIGNDKNYPVYIYNSKGMLLIESKESQINISGLSNGLYFICFKNKIDEYIKLIKQ